MWITDVIDESYRVAWGDLCHLKSNLLEVLLTGTVGPLLYLLAFGYGIGGSMGGGEEYVAFILPGILALATLSATFSTVSMRTLIQRLFYMSFDELLLCPIHVSAVVVGKTLAGMARVVISCSIILLVGCLIVPDASVNVQTVLILLLSAFMFSLLGFLAGIAVRRTNTLSLISAVVIVPMTFLCGTLFDVSALPSWAASVINVLPLTHVSELVRSAMGSGTVPLDSLTVVFVYTALFFGLCWYLIRTNRC